MNVSQNGADRPLILVLGAGASLGARATSDTPPPLGNRLGHYLRTWLDANELVTAEERFRDRRDRSPRYAGERLRDEPLRRLRDGLDEVVSAEGTGNPDQRTPFENLMDQWLQGEDGRDLLMGVQTLLAYAFLVGRKCAFHDSPDLLDNLVARLPALKAVVALNYDLLFEDALRRAGRRYTYPGVPGVSGRSFVSEGCGEPVPFFKIHGSINWLSLRADGGSADPEVARRNSKPVKYIDRGPFMVPQTYATYVPPNRESLFFELERHVSARTPVAAVYSTGKHVIENPDHVDVHRQACRDQIAELAEADVLLIGLRSVVEQDDPVLHDLLSRLCRCRGKKTFVNPSSGDCEKFRRFGCRPLRMPLEGWLATT